MSYSREKSFQCYECDKKFHQQSQLVVHIRQHTGEKPFVCSFCSKGFASLKVLKVHERVHTGERPYKCPYCDKSFSAYANLVVHRRIHTNEKPYICKLCSRGFEHSGNLSRHFRAHMVDTGFRCILCGKIFQLEQDLFEHTKSDHLNEYETYISSDKSRKHDNLVLTKQPNEIEISNDASLNSECAEETSTINFSDSSKPKERLITKINKREMRIIHSSSSSKSRSSPPKENLLLSYKTANLEETFPFSLESDESNLSPSTDTSNIYDNSERSWKSEVEELQISGNNYPLNNVSNSHSSSKKQLHLKKRKEHHISSMSESNHYLDYNSHSDGSPSSNDYYSECSPSSSDHFTLTRSPHSPSRDLASSFCNSSSQSCEDSSNHREDFHIMNDSSSSSNPAQDLDRYNSHSIKSKNYYSAPPPLIPIEDIDQGSELPTLEPFHLADSDHSECSLSSVMQDCDLYSDPVKGELEYPYTVEQKPKLEVKPDTNYISNVKGIIQKSLRQFITPEIQKEVFMGKVERALYSLVGKKVMEHFGYPERTCEQVLICILDMANRSPCADVRVNEIDRMKINMRKLIECSFPKKDSWDRLGWKGKPIEFILDNIQGQDS